MSSSVTVRPAARQVNVVHTPSIWRMLLRGDIVNHDPRIG